MEELDKNYCHCGYRLRDEEGQSFKDLLGNLKISIYLKSFVFKLAGIVV